MASGYDISASAASGLSQGLNLYNFSGISFGSSKQGAGDQGDASGGTVVATASRQQAGGNQAVPDSMAMNAYQNGGPDVYAPKTNWLPIIIAGAGVLLSVVLIIVLRKR